MKLVQKAWEINKNNLMEPWFAPDETVFADTVGKAKSQMLKVIGYDEHRDWKGEPITFLNLKVVRNKNCDRYDVGGEIKNLYQIQHDKERKEKFDAIDKMVADNPNGKAYIKKGGSYYRPDSCGYTERIIEAGIYTVQYAASSVKSCSLGDGMQMILINPTEHNKILNDKIEDLKSRLL